MLYKIITENICDDTCIIVRNESIIIGKARTRKDLSECPKRALAVMIKK